MKIGKHEGAEFTAMPGKVVRFLFDDDWERMTARERGIYCTLLLWLSRAKDKKLSLHNLHSLCGAGIGKQTLEVFLKKYGRKFDIGSGVIRYKAPIVA